MARKPRLFTVLTPLGYSVFLERDRWRTITKRKHPAMAGREKEVRECLKVPAIVRESMKEPAMHMYYVPKGNVHLCVVAAPPDETEYFVVTAYETANIKKGVERWKS